MIKLSKLSDEDKDRLKLHKAEHVSLQNFDFSKDLNSHMRRMRIHMMRGKSFDQAHDLAKAKDPKKSKEKKEDKEEKEEPELATKQKKNEKKRKKK